MSTQPSILIVDDDVDIRYTFKDALELFGYRTESASNGKEALELLRNSKSLPCMILLDLSMPVMNGQQLLENIALDGRLAPIPAVLVSADGNIPEKARHLGIREYLKKPLDLNDLERLAKKYCCQGSQPT